MYRNFGLNSSDALKRSLEIAQKDAENYPEIKDKILTAENICGVAKAFADFDADTCFKEIIALESNLKRLRKEASFIIKIWFMADKDQKIHLNDHLRFGNLLRKYKIHISQLCAIFPEIVCNHFVKYTNLLPNPTVKEFYANLKAEYIHPYCLAIMPKGKKYGGLAKVIIHAMTLRYFIDLGNGLMDVHSILSHMRTFFNSNICSQEKRLEYFQKFKINESDCKMWTQTFDQKFPELTHIHKFFEQIE